ncbi:MAG: prepilin-type N-terminal cleavage/methylation domain-containing protein [Microcella sp.]|uniref:prepilin-type N-terminal cleavage/methylation domain-containing protein n=1 Tax=Microcella sp. TaxID=1913979 RepID=UPI0024CACC73|nr:prepilin-type N-terminal cleavage/methylation domain-containing protein [Microcella sp.]UYN83280.1 MAG: prepilin-type N-terminal cleavage/methylation domain-containing protein [Microcella sp.]
MKSVETAHRFAASHDREAGFGLIEIVVSMFLLALLAVAFAPVLISAIRASAANTTTATATQLVNERMQIAQSLSPICANVAGLVGSATLVDSRDVTIEVTTIVGECPGVVGTVRVESVAVRLDTEEELARASTLVFVE